MKTVIIESPFGTKPDGTRASTPEIKCNIEYARACLRDSFNRGEAPFASHLLYPQVYNDADPDQRKKGIDAGLLLIGARLELTAVYTDRGMTSGMIEGIKRAEACRRPVEYRKLLPWSVT